MRVSVIDRKEDSIRTRHRPEVPATTEGEITALASSISAADIAAHVALTDPHTQYQREFEKDANSGYLGADASARLTSTRLSMSATDRLVGRSTAGAGPSEEVTCTAAGRALIDDAAASDQRTTLGLAALATLGTVGTAQIDNDAATYAKIQNVSATDKVLGRSTAGAGDIEEIACTAAARGLLSDGEVARVTSGSASCADATATTLYTMTAIGIYIIRATTSTAYTAWAVCTENEDGGFALLTTDTGNANFVLTVVGAAIKVTVTGLGTRTVTWRLLKI